MTLDIPGLRPPIISLSAEKKLREYLGFRHLFRKRYGFELDWDRMEKLLRNMPPLLAQMEKEIKSFFHAVNSLPKKAD